MMRPPPAAPRALSASVRRTATGLTALIAVLAAAPATNAQDADLCSTILQFGLGRFEKWNAQAARCRSEGGNRTRSIDKAADASPDAPVGPELAYAGGGQRRPRAIYVEDDRLEVDQLGRDLIHPKPSAITRAVRATTAVIETSRLKKNGETYRLTLKPFRPPPNGLPVCTSERFATQRAGAHCTGFLVAPDIVVTAGHCLNWSDVDDLDPENGTFSIVFGFEWRGGTERQDFQRDEVFRIRRIIDHAYERSGLRRDYAVLQLDRQVPRKIAEPLRLASTLGRDVELGTRLGVIGHPSGLAKKVSFKGRSQAMEAGNDVRFRAQLNTFKGNSGSPVLLFDEPDVVAGILVGGEGDYSLDAGGQCVRHVVYASDQTCDNGEPCSEKVTKISLVEPFISE